MVCRSAFFEYREITPNFSGVNKCTKKSEQRKELILLVLLISYDDKNNDNGILLAFIYAQIRLI
jgi:hypothetical protein